MGESNKKLKACAGIRKADIPELRKEFLRESLCQSATNGYNALYVFDASALIDLYYLRLMSTTLELVKDRSIITPMVAEETRRKIPTFDDHAVASLDCAVECRRPCDATKPVLELIGQHPEFGNYEKIALGVNYEVCPDKKLSDDPISKTDLHLLATTLSLAVHAADFGFADYKPVMLTADAHIHLPLKALSDPSSKYFRATSGKYRGMGVFHTATFRDELYRKEREWRKYAK